MSLWIIIVVITAFFQHVALPNVTFFGAHPNLVLTVVLAWGLLRGTRDGLIWALVGGILLDIFSLAPMGTATLSMLIVTFLVGLLEFTPFRVTLWLPVAAVFLATPLYMLIALTVLKSLGWSTSYAGILGILLPMASINALLMVLIFPLMRRVSGWAGQRAIEWRQW